MSQQDVLTLLSALLTGCIASIIGAVFAFHARFIRLEQQMKTVRADIRSMKRIVLKDVMNNVHKSRFYQPDDTQEIK